MFEIVATKPLNPYQGLKLPPDLILQLSFVSDKTLESLPGIETDAE